jgi:hypothetical protein
MPFTDIKKKDTIMKEINYDERTLMYGKYPKIQKLGACSPYGEMTPFVFNGRLMRMELVDISHGTGEGNSDIDFCEWQGKTYINYTLGNQLGFYCMCEAEYDGTVGEFLEGYFR